jgi:hypothetical protein
VDLIGKHGRVRTIPMPIWVKVAIDSWTEAAGVADGHVPRRINRGDQVQGEQMSEKVVRQLLQPYVMAAGVPRNRRSPGLGFNASSKSRSGSNPDTKTPEHRVWLTTPVPARMARSGRTANQPVTHTPTHTVPEIRRACRSRLFTGRKTPGVAEIAD